MTFRDYIPYYKRNLKLAFPIVFSQLGAALVQIVDTYFVGHLGTVELAAVSFASAIFLIVMLGSMGVLMGLTPLVGMAFVRGERNRVVDLFENGMLLTLLIIVIACGVLLLLIPLLPYMGQDPEVVAMALPFYQLMIVSLVPFLMFVCCKQFFEGLNNTLVAMLITILSNIINIVLAYMLIFGNWGAPALGVVGAGLATVVARLSMPLLYALVIRCKTEWWGYIRAFARDRLSAAHMRELLAVGIPISGQMVLEIVAFSLSGIMAGWLGATVLAANQIAGQVSNLCFMVVLGIGAATTIRVSHQIGGGDIDAAEKASNASTHLCLMYNAIAASVLLLFDEQIVSLFTSDPEVIAIGKIILICVAVFQLSDGLQCVGAGTLRGLTDVKVMMRYAFIAYICINIPLGYVLGFVFHLGAPGIWMGFIFGLSVAAVLFRRRARKRFRELKALAAQEAGDTLITD